MDDYILEEKIRKQYFVKLFLKNNPEKEEREYDDKLHVYKEIAKFEAEEDDHLEEDPVTKR